MANKTKTQRRREAAEYWDSHGIDEVTDGHVGVSLEVRKPLAAMLSFRLDEADLVKLKLIAKTQGVGVTTMARLLLHQFLENPKNQLVPQALRSEPARGKIAETPDGPEISSEGSDSEEFLVLSMQCLRQIDQLVTQNANRLFTESIREQAISITPSQPELFDKIKGLQPTD